MISLTQFCEERGQDPRAALDLMRVLEDRQTFEMARHQTLLDRRGTSREARKPLEDEGDEVGRVMWRMPGKAFFHLMQQRNFGWEGLTSDEGTKDILKGFPQFRVKTVSGKVVGVGFGGGSRQTVKRYNNEGAKL